MKNTSKILGALCVTCAAVLLLGSGCLTSSTPVVTSTTNSVGQVVFATNDITTVNQAQLLVDTAVVQGAASIAVSAVVQKDPTAIPTLKAAQGALNDLLNGASSNTTAQILGTINQGGNTNLAIEITPLIASISAAEQSLLAKYGTNVGGQITLAIAKAVNGGFAVGLGGH